MPPVASGPPATPPLTPAPSGSAAAAGPAGDPGPAAEESYRAIFEHASDAMWVHDLETGAFLEVNEAAVAMYGYTAEEQKAMGIAGLSTGVAPWRVEDAMPYVRRAAAGEPQRFEWLGRHKDGRPVWGEVRLRRVRLGGVDRLLATARDINDRVAAATALRAANEALAEANAALERRVAERTAQLRETQRVARIGSWHWELATNTVVWDETLAELYDVAPEDAPRDFAGYLALVHPDDRAHARAVAERALATGEPYMFDHRVRTADGSTRYLHGRGEPVRAADGTLLGLVGSAQDVTERKRAELALAEREAHFRRLIENSSDYVMVVDGAGTIGYVGPSVRRMLGYAPEEMLGGRPVDFVHPDDVPQLLEALAQYRADPRSATVIQYRMRHKDGRWLVVENVGRAVNPDAPEEGLIANCRDITDRVEAERALREQDERFRRLIESAGDLVVTIDAAGRLTYVSPSSAWTLGWDAQELLGQPATVILAEEDVARGLEELARVIARPGEPQTSTVHLRRRDGDRRTFESVARTISPTTAAEGVIAIARDVTDRLAAEAALQRSEEHFRTLIENAHDIVVVMEPHTGQLTYQSPSMQRILGYAPEELAGENAFALVHPDDMERAIAEVTRALGTPGLTAHAEYRYRHKDGSWRHLETFGRTLSPTSAEHGVVFNTRDVTDRAAAGEALARAKEEAERANRAKSDFLSRMSHELRTPMNSILGFAQLLARAELPAAQAKGVQHILKAGRHLLRLINEVLEISRIEAGREHLALEPVALAAAAQEALGLVRPLAQQHGVTLHDVEGEAPEAVVRADRQRLVQVLLNLLSNAIKYNRPGGSVRLDVRRAGDGRWAVRVHDTGPGIPADRAGELFTPFARLGAEQTEVEGTGLGLALSQRLCEAMGGALALEASGAGGSTFRVELAGADGAPGRREDTGTYAVPTPGGAPATLLYVEDNAANRSLVESILLARPGWQVLVAARGGAGVALARAERPDLVLLDLHLPDIDGVEVLRQLRADARTAAIPVVVVSADATAASLERLRAAGADAYLTKPIDVDEFLGVVDRFLEGRAAPAGDG